MVWLQRFLLNHLDWDVFNEGPVLFDEFVYELKVLIILKVIYHPLESEFEEQMFVREDALVVVLQGTLVLKLIKGLFTV